MNKIIIKRRLFSPKLKNRFWNKVDISIKSECWNWKATTSGKYGMFWFNGIMVLSHRFAFAIFYNREDILINNKSYHKEIDEYLCILHKCDNPICCNPFHLFIGINKDNIDDKVSKNRAQKMRGSLNGYSKLNEKDILKIRRIYKPRKNGGLTKIAKEYNVGITTIHDIIKRKIWKHV